MRLRVRTRLLEQALVRRDVCLIEFVAEVPEARASAPGSAARAARAQLVPRVAPTGGHGPAWASMVPPSSR